MFTHYNKYREINLKFPSFAPQHNSSKLDFVLGLASVVILSSSEGSRYVFGTVSARDPSALRFVGMTRDVWVNYYITS